MSRFTSALAAALLSLCWHAAVDAAYVKTQVQLAVSGDDFFSFGSIFGDIQEDVRFACACAAGCNATSDKLEAL